MAGSDKSTCICVRPSDAKHKIAGSGGDGAWKYDGCMRGRVGPTGLGKNEKVAIMAVVNRTPDSFYDKGATYGLDASVRAAIGALDAGAHWIDIGGVPFGRGPHVSAEEECERVVPFVRALLRERPEAVISVDTYRAQVAREALEAGAQVINDTSGFVDADMIDVIAQAGAYAIVCHSAGKPREEKPAAYYEDVVAEVVAFVRECVERLRQAGVASDRIIVDPGHDLDKNTLHSLELTRRLGEIVDLGFPVMVAVSNKDFIGECTKREQGQRLAGSLAAMTACVMSGARIVRMHDIDATVDAVHMTEAILGLREPFELIHNTHPTHNV